MPRIAQLIQKAGHTATFHSQLTTAEIDALRHTVMTQPYYQAAHIMLTQALYAQESCDYGQALHMAAISCPDRVALRQHIQCLQHSSVPSTGRTSGQRRITPTPDPTNDYIGYLMSTQSDSTETVAQTPQSHTIDLIDQFLGHCQPGERAELPQRDDNELLQPDTEQNTSTFTQTMARIYIKQGKYQRAMKILQQITPDNSQKNAYFADQMRYLRLLIENQAQENE